MARTVARIAAGIAGLVTLGSTVVAGTGVAMAGPAAAVSPAATGAWRIVKQVHSGSSGDFTAVVATGKSSGWAFNANLAALTKPTAWQRNGNSWTQAAFPSKSGEEVVAAGAASPSDVWAFTNIATRSRVLHWNGHMWSVAHVFTGLVGGASVVSRTDVWVFGQPGINQQLGNWHYNGHRWSELSRSLDGGSALSATSVWAFRGTSVYHFNGHKWSRTSVATLLPPKLSNGLNDPMVTGIYAQSAKSVYAIGNGQAQDEGGPTVVLHYNGHGWSNVAEGSYGYGTLPLGQQISPDGSGGLWLPMPGYAGMKSYVLHYSAGKLITAPLPRAALRIDVVSVAHVPGSTDMLAGGFTHASGNPVSNVTAVILQYGG